MTVNNRKTRDTLIISFAILLPLSFSLYFAHEDISKEIAVKELNKILNQANNLYNKGYLNEAINYSNKVLSNISSPKEFPEQYAGTQELIGNCYFVLSLNGIPQSNNTRNNSSETNLNISSEAGLSKLQEPYLSKSMEANLRKPIEANFSKSIEANFSKSIEAYKEALTIYNINNYPIKYAFVNSHLGDAYRSLGFLQTNSTDKNEYFSKADEAYINSLGVINDNNYPEEYSRLMNNTEVYRVSKIIDENIEKSFEYMS